MFIASDLTQLRQKLSSELQADVGELPAQGNKTIPFFVISLIEGNIELIQKVWYQTNKLTTHNNPKEEYSVSTNRSDSSDKVVMPELTAKAVQQQRPQSHNINIENLNDVLIKSKTETISIVCTPEFLFTGKFFSLNKQPLTKAFKNEDFLLRINLEVKSVDIDVLDMFLICVSKKSIKKYKKELLIFCLLFIRTIT